MTRKHCLKCLYGLLLVVQKNYTALLQICDLNGNNFIVTLAIYKYNLINQFLSVSVKCWILSCHCRRIFRLFWWPLLEKDIFLLDFEKNKQYVVLHSKYSITVLAVYYNYHCLIMCGKFVTNDFNIILLLSTIN